MRYRAKSIGHTWELEDKPIGQDEVRGHQMTGRSYRTSIDVTQELEEKPRGKGRNYKTNIEERQEVEDKHRGKGRRQRINIEEKFGGKGQTQRTEGVRKVREVSSPLEGRGPTYKRLDLGSLTVGQMSEVIKWTWRAGRSQRTNIDDRQELDNKSCFLVGVRGHLEDIYIGVRGQIQRKGRNKRTKIKVIQRTNQRTVRSNRINLEPTRQRTNLAVLKQRTSRWNNQVERQTKRLGRRFLKSIAVWQGLEDKARVPVLVRGQTQ